MVINWVATTMINIWIEYQNITVSHWYLQFIVREEEIIYNVLVAAFVALVAALVSDVTAAVALAAAAEA